MGKKALRPAEVFGLRVEEARGRNRWTQQQLADRLTELGRKTDRATIARVEHGKTLAALDMVIAIAAALHVPPVHLLVPLEEDAEVAITASFRVAAPEARAWIRGAGLLPGTDLLDIWPHLPESEQRRLVTQPSDPKTALALALEGWFEPQQVEGRLNELHDAAKRRKIDNG